MTDDRVPMIQIPSANAKRAGETVTCCKKGHRNASLWSRYLPVAVMVLSTILSAVPAVLTWKNHETEARNIILERLSEKVWPRDHIRLSAKALYDSVSSPRRELSLATYIDAL